MSNSDVEVYDATELYLKVCMMMIHFHQVVCNIDPLNKKYANSYSVILLPSWHDVKIESTPI